MYSSKYLESIVKIRLSQLVPEQPTHTLSIGDIVSVDLDKLKQDQTYVIAGRITHTTRDALLEETGISSRRLRHDSAKELHPLMPNYEVYCHAGFHCLDSVKAALGADFECTVRLYCIPPAQGVSISDGDAFRNVRFYKNNGRLNVAQEWMDCLSKSKRHILSLMLQRASLMECMDRLLPLACLWEDLQLGNWARHMAAHIPNCMENYLDHIRFIWVDRIFSNLGHLIHLVRHEDVLSLQYRAPSWSSSDRADIKNGFEDGKLFKDIHSPRDRSALQRNLLSLNTVIPTFQTFNDNMRYIAIGTKILENHIEFIPKKRSAEKRDTVYSKNWSSCTPKVEVFHGQFRTLHLMEMQPGIQLLLAALRYFPRLSLDSPLLGDDGEHIAAIIDETYVGLLCRQARELGFDNEKIRKGCQVPIEDIEGLCEAPDSTLVPRSRLFQQSSADWRGGKPTTEVFKALKRTAFLPNISAKFPRSDRPDVLCILSDILKAFFKFRSLDLDRIDGDQTESVDLIMSTPPPAAWVLQGTAAKLQQRKAKKQKIQQEIKAAHNSDRTTSTPRHRRNNKAIVEARRQRHRNKDDKPLPTAQPNMVRKKKTSTEAVSESVVTGKTPTKKLQAFMITRKGRKTKLAKTPKGIMAILRQENRAPPSPRQQAPSEPGATRVHQDNIVSDFHSPNDATQFDTPDFDVPFCDPDVTEMDLAPGLEAAVSEAPGALLASDTAANLLPEQAELANFEPDIPPRASTATYLTMDIGVGTGDLGGRHEARQLTPEEQPHNEAGSSDRKQLERRPGPSIPSEPSGINEQLLTLLNEMTSHSQTRVEDGRVLHDYSEFSDPSEDEIPALPDMTDGERRSPPLDAYIDDEIS
ncbi:DUF3723 domain protein [Metarhizium robertsii]|uniref:DUF3723 domain protein n=1 Tax=Metarhizium robertsii TaxID=568076 RepID=A0A014MVW4_9HYPO|nr:DUF3723 domain protein [Metarhizium robertsii]